MDKKENITIRIDKEMYKWLKNKAEKERRSVSSLGVIAIYEYYGKTKEQEKYNGSI